MSSRREPPFAFDTFRRIAQSRTSEQEIRPQPARSAFASVSSGRTTRAENAHIDGPGFALGGRMSLKEMWTKFASPRSPAPVISPLPRMDEDDDAQFAAFERGILAALLRDDEDPEEPVRH